MKYRAVCPHCGARLSRKGYFKPFDECPVCLAGIRPEPKWNTAGNLFMGGLLSVVTVCGLAIAVFKGPLGWAIVAGGFVVVMTIGWVFFPHATPYELLTPGRPMAAADAAAAPDDALPAYVLPPPSDYLRKTLIGLALCVMGMFLWYSRFKDISKEQHTPATAPAATQSE
jgi:hypothetical protein